uniref:Putative secreted protein n=1 Tax=Anopheles marajoara TaxID=58244 RepID=A0A2M4CF52_9DIPT
MNIRFSDILLLLLLLLSSSKSIPLTETLNKQTNNDSNTTTENALADAAQLCFVQCFAFRCIRRKARM